jgi:pimeloyl-ACP methyl ester carboxylesterase
LHGGLGNSGDWGYQVPALLKNGYLVLLIDSRGHGRSTRDDRLFSYELMASEVMAVMDALHLEPGHLGGMERGACTALILAATAPMRVAGVFFFACNMDPSGVKPFEPTPTLNRCFARHAKGYAELSTTPEHFTDLVRAVTLMQQTQPNYSIHDLAKIRVPVAIVQSEHEEFHQTRTRRIFSPLYSRYRVYHPQARDPLCSSAETGTIQRSNAEVCKQGLTH